MKELENISRKELFEMYTMYLSSKDKLKIQEKARTIYNKYIPAKTILSEETMSFVTKLFAIAYPDSNSGLNTPTREEAEKILKELQK